MTLFHGVDKVRPDGPNVDHEEEHDQPRPTGSYGTISSNTAVTVNEWAGDVENAQPIASSTTTGPPGERDTLLPHAGTSPPAKSALVKRLLYVLIFAAVLSASTLSFTMSRWNVERVGYNNDLKYWEGERTRWAKDQKTHSTTEKQWKEDRLHFRQDYEDWLVEHDKREKERVEWKDLVVIYKADRLKWKEERAQMRVERENHSRELEHWKQERWDHIQEVVRWEKHWEAERREHEQEKERWDRAREEERNAHQQEKESWDREWEQERVMREQEKESWNRDWGKERQLRETEKEEWERERRKHEDNRIPPGAFWQELTPSTKCHSYGKREYTAELENVPYDWTLLDACRATPVEINDVSIRRPDTCYLLGSGGVVAHWLVDFGETACKTWHDDWHDTGCINEGSKSRRIEAQVRGIQTEDDWEVMCGTTPATWNHVYYEHPTHCANRRWGRKVAIWDIEDASC